VDLPEGGRSDRAALRSQIPPGACQSATLKALGLSLQKPERRAYQRDEEAIRRFKEERWPELKKGL
jgi:hypothetical protein